MLINIRLRLLLSVIAGVALISPNSGAMMSGLNKGGMQYLAKLSEENKKKQKLEKLLEATKNGSISEEEICTLIDECLKENLDINKQDQSGMNLLHYAYNNGYKKVTKHLIQCKADINIKNYKGDTPLMQACIKGDNITARILLEADADIHEINDKTGFSALFYSCMYNHYDTLQVLFEFKVDIDRVVYAQRALNIACLFGLTKIAQALLEEGADINGRISNGDSPLHTACISDENINVRKMLIYNKANPNAQNGDGNTPLHIASSQGNVNAIGILLSNGASVKITNKNGQTAFDVAATEKIKTYLLDLYLKMLSNNFYAIEKSKPAINTQKKIRKSGILDTQVEGYIKELLLQSQMSATFTDLTIE